MHAKKSPMMMTCKKEIEKHVFWLAITDINESDTEPLFKKKEMSQMFLRSILKIKGRFCTFFFHIRFSFVLYSGFLFSTIGFNENRFAGCSERNIQSFSNNIDSQRVETV